MKIVQKFPVNPNMIMFLIPQQLTTKMSEMFSSPVKAQSHPFVHHFFAVEGIRRIQITRYELRVFKKRETGTWNEILPQITEVIKNIFPGVTIENFSEVSESHTLRYPGNFTSRAVYEGVEVAANDPMAQKLFAIPGVERVLFDSEGIQIRCCAIFCIKKIRLQISKIID